MVGFLCFASASNSKIVIANDHMSDSSVASPFSKRSPGAMYTGVPGGCQCKDCKSLKSFLIGLFLNIQSLVLLLDALSADNTNILP